MFDTPEQIRNQLRAGEDGRAEFKEVCFGDRAVPSPDTEELAGELVAFANAEGGVVFLGVDDSGAARGIPPERLDSVEHWLLNVANHNCDPPIRRSADPPGRPQGNPAGRRRRRLSTSAGGGAAGTVCAPNIGRPLLHADWVHKAGSHAAGACPAVPAARPRVRVRRAARACRRRGRPQPQSTRGVLRTITDDSLARPSAQHSSDLSAGPFHAVGRVSRRRNPTSDRSAASSGASSRIVVTLFMFRLSIWCNLVSTATECQPSNVDASSCPVHGPVAARAPSGEESVH